MGRLNDKVAVVTGGNSGIGYATAKRFRDEGARVVISGRRPDAVKKAAEELGEDVVGIVADAADSKAVQGLVDQVKERFGRIDVLFVNAGVAPFAALTEQTEDAFDRLFAINVKGPYFMVQKALPVMNAGSSIILNASVAAQTGIPGASAYSATKAAVRSFVRSFAAELAPTGIRVNALSPGPIETPLFDKAGLEQKEIDEFGEQLAGKVPLGRFGTVDEMAGAALFLASDDASYVNGADLQADGGFAQV